MFQIHIPPNLNDVSVSNIKISVFEIEKSRAHCHSSKKDTIKILKIGTP